MPDVTLSVRGLCVPTAEGPDFQNLAFEVFRGEAVAITSLGPSDLPCLFEVLSGLRWPVAGEVNRGDISFSPTLKNAQPRFEGYRKRRLYRMTSGVLSPAVALVNNLTLYDNIALPLRYHFAPSERIVRERTWRLIEILNLSAEATAKPAGLPRGVVRRAQLARALILEPSILFLDSPLSDIDNDSTRRMFSALGQFLDHGLLTVVAVSYDPLPLLPLVRRVIVLYDGRLAGTLEGEQLDESEFLQNLGRLVGDSRKEEGEECARP